MELPLSIYNLTVFRVVIKDWQEQYNNIRSHRSLGLPLINYLIRMLEVPLCRDISDKISPVDNGSDALPKAL